MPRDEAGTYRLPSGTLVTTGDKVLPSQHNPPFLDVEKALTDSVARDGSGGMAAALNMNNFRINNLAPGTIDSDAATVGQAALPVGTIIDYAGASAPDGYLLCFGQAVSRVTYAKLFAVIGTTFGTGNGSTTFNLPDLRGRVIAGKDDMGGADSRRLSEIWGALAKAIGGVFGLAWHNLSANELAKHTHSGWTASMNRNASHTHGYTVGLRYLRQEGGSAGAVWYNDAAAVTSATDTNHEHSFTTNTGDGVNGDAHNNTQPTIIMNKLIKY